jgi:ABC-type transport system involved in multi-copper enzyme maturation permease subunit
MAAFQQWMARLDRAQRSKGFRIVAACVAVALAIVAIVVYSVSSEKVRLDSLARVGEFERQAIEAQGPAPEAEAPKESKDPSGVTLQSKPDDAIKATSQLYQNLVSAQQSTTNVALGIGAVLVLALVVIWLGLGLTYVGLIVVCAITLWLATLVGLGKTAAPVVVGVVALAAAFTALLKLARMLLSGSHPVLSIAHNALLEAVRLRVYLVFILFMMFLLAALPLLQAVDQPLRYRVQSFLQYGTGGSFWVIALLITLFSVATVATEQRDKVIWQTATKPVAAWQYVLGKWLGVSALALVLLTVSATGVFLMTEYLRRQPAIGETTAFVPKDERLLAEDRMLLETEVLTSRQMVGIDPPEFDPKILEENIRLKIDEEKARITTFGSSPEEVASNLARFENEIRGSLGKSVNIAFRTLGPGESRYYVFRGLGEAKRRNVPLTLRYKINVGGNMPDRQYKLTVGFPAMQAAQVLNIPPAQVLTLQLLPSIISDDGTVTMLMANADIFAGVGNPDAMTFSDDTLTLSYSSGSFQWNFLRLMGVLWIKLAFLAMLGVVCGTFLSFPVATLVAVSTFFIAEGTPYLVRALESFSTTDLSGKTQYGNLIIKYIADVVAWLGTPYGNLRPTQRLVDGESLSWAEFAMGALVLGLVTVVMYMAGVMIFRKRELAMYSGQ